MSPGDRGAADDPHPCRLDRSGERERAHAADGLYGAAGAHALLELRERPRPARAVADGIERAGNRKQHPRRHDVRRIEARPNSLQLDEGSRQQRGPDEKHHRQRDFGRHKRAPAEPPRDARCRTRAGGIQRGGQPGPANAQRRAKCEQHCRDEGDAGGKGQHPPINGDVVGPREPAWDKWWRAAGKQSAAERA